MIGDSLDSVPGVPPDKYYNPGSHITLKCIIRLQLCKSLHITIKYSRKFSRLTQSITIFIKMTVNISFKCPILIFDSTLIQVSNQTNRNSWYFTSSSNQILPNWNSNLYSRPISSFKSHIMSSVLLMIPAMSEIYELYLIWSGILLYFNQHSMKCSRLLLSIETQAESC